MYLCQSSKANNMKMSSVQYESVRIENTTMGNHSFQRSRTWGVVLQSMGIRSLMTSSMHPSRL